MQVTKMQTVSKVSVRTASVKPLSVAKPSISRTLLVKQPVRFMCRAEPVSTAGNEYAQIENCQAPAGDLPAREEAKTIQKAENEAKRQEREEQGQAMPVNQAGQTTPEGEPAAEGQSRMSQKGQDA